MTKLGMPHAYQTLQRELTPLFNQREPRIDLETATGRPP